MDRHDHVIKKSVPLVRRSARRHYVAEWFLEFSVLWAVFPMLDQMLTGRFQAWILAVAWSLSVLSFVLGFVMRSKD